MSKSRAESSADVPICHPRCAVRKPLTPALNCAMPARGLSNTLLRAWRTRSSEDLKSSKASGSVSVMAVRTYPSRMRDHRVYTGSEQKLPYDEREGDRRPSAICTTLRSSNRVVGSRPETNRWVDQKQMMQNLYHKAIQSTPLPPPAPEVASSYRVVQTQCAVHGAPKYTLGRLQRWPNQFHDIGHGVEDSNDVAEFFDNAQRRQETLRDRRNIPEAGGWC